jgi:hypothetical protein
VRVAGFAGAAGVAADAVSRALAVPSPAMNPECRGAVAAAALAPSAGGDAAASSAGFFRNRRPRPRRWNELSIAAAARRASPRARAARVTRSPSGIPSRRSASAFFTTTVENEMPFCATFRFSVIENDVCT